MKTRHKILITIIAIALLAGMLESCSSANGYERTQRYGHAGSDTLINVVDTNISYDSTVRVWSTPVGNYVQTYKTHIDK